MKFTSTVAALALGAIAISSSAQAALSAPCSTYLTALSAPTNPLAKCRVYTALGFPALTHANDHDTVKLQKAITDYCATPACTPEQYAGVFKDINANCQADMVTANQADLGATMYMWYLSAPQREAICTQSSKNTTCVIDSINEMVARAQFPNDNKNEDDLYGYLQYVTPMMSAKGTNATAFCTQCNQQLTSAGLNSDLTFQYKSACSVALGPDFKPQNPSTNSTKPGDKKPEDNKNSGASAVAMSMGGVAATVAAIAGALAMF
ncbi:hypothetical protein BGZ95_000133 [Linnemannia exigua]|uniref:Secreted protein n=1 Tax=Linnemannia exigua TaxID=604196 RepID=A0AAD4D8P1_9FUNG|nr:hypothetical protein BGZ95_000133 [Linnemannia exigua]